LWAKGPACTETNRQDGPRRDRNDTKDLMLKLKAGILKDQLGPSWKTLNARMRSL